jgi:hypothetical protein
MGLTMQEKKAVARQLRSRRQNSGRKEKSATLDKFIRITGYENRKYALRVLNKRETPEFPLSVDGKTVKVKSANPKPPNRKSKNIYTGEVIASLHLILAFFRFKGGKLLVPLTRRQMNYAARRTAFDVSPTAREKLISPAFIDRALKK